MSGNDTENSSLTPSYAGIEQTALAVGQPQLAIDKTGKPCAIAFAEVGERNATTFGPASAQVGATLALLATHLSRQASAITEQGMDEEAAEAEREIVALSSQAIRDAKRNHRQLP